MESAQNEELFEQHNVHLVYDKIASHFSITRIMIWPKVHDFINDLPSNSTILDIGCGNGKNMGTREDCQYIGIDICQNLIQQATYKPNCNYLISNCLTIPLPDNSMDYIMSIAVIHHLSTPERRLQSLIEINRLLNHGGKALIYVWAFEQPKFKNELEQDVMVKWSLQKKYNQENQQVDILNRYYHLFRENELEDMINKIDGLTIIDNLLFNPLLFATFYYQFYKT